MSVTWLSSKVFQVCVAWVLSPLFPVSTGVPQGSSMSSLLFVLYMADLPRFPSAGVFHLLMTLLCCFQDLMPSRLLFMPRSACAPWVCIFSAGGFAPILQNQSSSFLPSIVYLGMFLDYSLLWHHHTSVLDGRAAGTLCSVHPLLVSSCPLLLDVRVRLWQSLVVPILFYGAAVWAYIPFSTHDLVVSAYHRGLRVLLGVPVFTVGDLLYHLCSVCPPSTVLDIATAFYHCVARHRNPLVAALDDYIVLDPHLHRRTRNFLLTALD
ncbi:hypothetical protein PR048_025600 [Dryococelus australis]|uniref:Uncharacterized protein n=1 Tax=Dryococelus australis TaxID=614101 RepID=A0ABQ9GRW0_9NEOP|nr:hypothetical protein PR048_025600 [Dryococelus australis]